MTIGEMTQAAGIERFDLQIQRINGRSHVLMLAGKGTRVERLELSYLPGCIDHAGLQIQLQALCRKFQ